MTAKSFRYLTPATQEALDGLVLSARGPVEGRIAGMHRSKHKGSSVEFAEYREYVPGDPVRHLDHRVLARSDRRVIRQYEDETNLQAYVLVDRSASMAFSGDEARPTKWAYACSVAGGLVYLLHRQRDASGLVVFAETVDRTLPARGSPTAVREALETLEAFAPDGKTGVGTALRSLAARLTRRSLVVVLSDLHDDPDDVAHGLRRLRFDRHDVAVLQVLDDAELDLPYRGLVELEDLETGERLPVEAGTMRDAYREAVDAWLKGVGRTMAQAGVEHRVLRTSKPFSTEVARFVHARGGT